MHFVEAEFLDERLHHRRMAAQESRQVTAAKKDEQRRAGHPVAVEEQHVGFAVAAGAGNALIAEQSSDSDQVEKVYPVAPIDTRP